MHGINFLSSDGPEINFDPLIMFGDDGFSRRNNGSLTMYREQSNSCETYLLPPKLDMVTEPDYYECLLAQQCFGSIQTDRSILEQTSKNTHTPPVKNVKNQKENFDHQLLNNFCNSPSTIFVSEFLNTDGSIKYKREHGKEELASKQASKNVCSHCSTTKTSLWRRCDGKIVCNACALYHKLHGVHRPAHLINSVIRKRNRKSYKKSQEDENQ